MIFDEGKHEYIHNNTTYISVTQLLKKYGLSADYANIPQAVLDKAATKGKAVHSALEQYIKGDKSMVSLFDEVRLIDQYITQTSVNLGTAKSEEIVFDDQYQIAGTVDFQFIDGNDYVVADFKTTSSLHMDAVSWQLSVYNYIITKGDLLTYYTNKLRVFHLTNGRLYVKEVPSIDIEQVRQLLQAHISNQPTFQYVRTNNSLTDADETLIAQILQEKATYTGVIERLDEELNKVLERVKTNMITNKTYKYVGPQVTVTYVQGQVRNSLATDKVKKFLIASGQNVDDFTTTSTTKDSVRVVLSKPTGDTDGDIS